MNTSKKLQTDGIVTSKLWAKINNSLPKKLLKLL